MIVATCLWSTPLMLQRHRGHFKKDFKTKQSRFILLGDMTIEMSGGHQWSLRIKTEK